MVSIIYICPYAYTYLLATFFRFYPFPSDPVVTGTISAL